MQNGKPIFLSFGYGGRGDGGAERLRSFYSSFSHLVENLMHCNERMVRADKRNNTSSTRHRVGGRDCMCKMQATSF